MSDFHSRDIHGAHDATLHASQGEESAPTGKESGCTGADSGTYRVLMICTADHSRSPLAAAMLRAEVLKRGLQSRVAIESGAVRNLKVGEPPSEEMVEVGRRRGLAVEGQARWASPERIAAADLVVCMDASHMEELAVEATTCGAPLDAACSGSDSARVRLLLSFAPWVGRAEVPDPHGRDLDTHERVADLIAAGVEGLVRWIERRVGAA